MSLDLLDSYLNECYTDILQMTDWTGLHAHATIETIAAYQSPTNPPSPPTESVTLTTGSANVTGVGTAWTAATVGRFFFRPGDNVVYAVTAVASPTALTLDRPYEGVGSEAPGTVYAGASYTLFTDIYSLPADARSPVTVLNPVNGKPMAEMTKDNLDVSRGTRATVADPWTFAVYDDSSEASPPVLHRIQFYPPPLRARGYQLEYLRNPNVFNGTNTSASPLPFVTDSVLLNCCRSKIWIHLEKPTKAAGYSAASTGELNRLLLNEHSQTRALSALHMAPRFTRHRLRRVDRTYGRGWGPGQGGPN